MAQRTAYTINLQQVAEIANTVREIEQHLDEVFGKGGALMAAIGRLRAELALPSNVGHPIASSYAAMLTSVIEAKDHALRGHERWVRTAVNMGIDPDMPGFGDGQPKSSAYGENLSISVQENAPVVPLRAVG